MPIDRYVDISGQTRMFVWLYRIDHISPSSGLDSGDDFIAGKLMPTSNSYFTEGSEVIEEKG